jgi:hypothetical protein
MRNPRLNIRVYTYLRLSYFCHDAKAIKNSAPLIGADADRL